MEQSYTTSFLSIQAPRLVYRAVRNVRAWWTAEAEGRSENAGDVFEVILAGVHHSTQQVIETLPGRRIIWRVTDSRLGIPGAEGEWTGTQICFDIARRGLRTQLRFTHLGLTPELKCFVNCSRAWDLYIRGSLRGLIGSSAGMREYVPPPKKPLSVFTAVAIAGIMPRGRARHDDRRGETAHHA